MTTQFPHEVTDSFVRLSQDKQIVSKIDTQQLMSFCHSNATNLCLLLTNIKRGANFFRVYYDGDSVSEGSDASIIPFPSSIPTDGLVLKYDMNDISGSAVPDTSGNDLHGTLNGGATVYNNCVRFNGEDSQYISIPAHQFVGLNGFSVSLWFYDRRRYESYGRLLDIKDGSDNNRICLQKQQSNSFNMQFFVQDRTHVFSCIRYYNWSHIVATIDSSGTMNIYFDGEHISSYSANPATIVTRVRNYIGRSFLGDIGALRLYSKAITHDEVVTLFQEGFGRHHLPIFNDVKINKEESGNWIVDGYTFYKRRFFGITSDTNIPKAVISIPKERFAIDDEIRIVRLDSIPEMLPCITTAVPSVVGLHPKNNELSFIAEHVDRNGLIATGTIQKRSLEVPTDTNGKIGILSRIETKDVKVVIDWIRARKFSMNDVVQLKRKDSAILFNRLPTDWYLFDTQASQSPNKDSIDSAITSAPDFVISTSKRRWLEFGKQDVVNTGLPYGMHFYK